MSALQFNLNYRFGSDLREVPEDPASMQLYVDYLQNKIKEIQNPRADQIRPLVKFLGEVGSYARMLKKLEVAERALEQSLALIDEHKLGLSTWAVHTLRYGDVLRFKKDELGAETAYRSVLEFCERFPALAEFEDFAWQHFGKLRFDQKDFVNAEDFFKRALALRKKKGVKELIDSTEVSLRVIKMKK